MSESASQWFYNFLRQELTPYPGRVSTVARMVTAVTLTMLIIMTFHLPAGALGGYYALIISRESLRNTLQQTWLTIVFFCLGTVYVLVGVAMFVDSPVTHFLWVIGSFYLIFFVMGTARNYGLAAGFSFLIATAIPLWDRPGEVNLKIALTLYTLLAVIVGALCTLFVEAVYRSFHPEDPVVIGIADRLRVVGRMLHSAAEGTEADTANTARLLQYAMVGPSSMRRQLIRAGISAEVRARVAAAISMSGRLVELCAAGVAELTQGIQPDPADRQRLQVLAQVITAQALALSVLPEVAQIGSASVPAWKGSEVPSAKLRLLPELERSVAVLADVFNSFGVRSTENEIVASGVEQARQKTRTLAIMFGAQPSAILVEDAFSNRDHLVFALRGCLAASICYIIYNGIDWPGINTAVATCIITALGTIGSSRQKQVLRIAGAIAGGFLISLPAQVFLLPHIDSITAFTLFFASVSGIAAWFATSSPRLSYFGLQIALAFYLVNLQESTVQISLAVARDRVVGVLLGLMSMWLVFDQIAAPLATERMMTLLRANLKLMGDMAVAVAATRKRDHASSDGIAALRSFRELRDKINDNFSQMNAQADAVQFEFGARRARQLQERERMLAMQPAMRSIFLIEIALFASEHLPSGLLPGGEDSEQVRRTLTTAGTWLHQLANAPRFDELGASSLLAGDVAAGVAMLDAKLRSEPPSKPDLGGHETGTHELCLSLASSLKALKDAAQKPVLLA